jgi:hypothetical protein
MMDCSVVKIAYGDEILQLVTSAAALVFDVMHVEPDGPAAPGHAAAMAVSRQHMLALARRDRRGDSLRCGRIERAEVNRVALGTLHHGRIDLDVTPAGVLPRSLAVRALFERDLVSG